MAKPCALCGETPTLRIVGKQEFCKKHVPEAFELANKVGYKNDSGK